LTKAKVISGLFYVECDVKCQLVKLWFRIFSALSHWC